MIRIIVWSTLLLILTATAQAASIVDVSVIRITNTNNDWLQVSEIVATDSGGYDVALSSIVGVVATSGGVGANGPESNAINGVAPGYCLQTNCSPPNGEGIYHSSSTVNAFLQVTLAVPTELFSLSIFGRTDGIWSMRDVYDVELFNTAGDSLLFVGGASADNPDYRADIFQTVVPIPAAVWLFVSGLVAIGVLRRK